MGAPRKKTERRLTLPQDGKHIGYAMTDRDIREGLLYCCNTNFTRPIASVYLLNTFLSVSFLFSMNKTIHYLRICYNSTFLKENRQYHLIILISRPIKTISIKSFHNLHRAKEAKKEQHEYHEAERASQRIQIKVLIVYISSSSQVPLKCPS